MSSSTPTPFLSPRRFRSFFFLCLLLGSTGSGVALAEAPDPADGQWAAATTALLRYQKDVCDRLAVRVLDHWSTLAPADPEKDEERIRNYVLAGQVSDLATARSAGDLVNRFLPGAQKETNSETVGSLRRLDGLIGELCDAVALPVAPAAAFRAKISEILDRVELEQAELGRLLVVSEEAEQAALEPYLLPIQTAGMEAEGEYLAYLNSLRPKAKEPTIHDRMRAWHTAVYSPGVAPAKKAFGLYLKARKNNDSRTMGKSCRSISATVSVLLREEQIFAAPDPRVSEPLRRIYVDMRRLAKECVAGRARETQARFEDLQESLKTAGSQLSRYSLSP